MKAVAIVLLCAACAFARFAANPQASSFKPAFQAAGQAGNKPKPPHSAQRAATPGTTSPAPDEGSVSGKTYTSDYFNFSYTFPEHLVVDENFMQDQEDAAKQTFLLLAAYGPAPEGQRKEGVVVMADRLNVALARDDTGWVTGYLDQLSRLLAAQGAQPVGATREYSFGGKKFFRADFQRGGPDPGFQSFLVSLRRGYVLAFDFVSTTAKQTDQLLGSLNSLNFAPAVRR